MPTYSIVPRGVALLLFMLTSSLWVPSLGAEEPLADTAGPQDVDAMVQRARVEGLANHPEEACDWLERAGATGYVDVYALRKDEAFAGMRDHPRFRALLRAIWAKGYIAMLERPERDDFQKPEEILTALALRLGERVADVGSGSGYFTLRLARAVGPTGIVWAVDIAPELLEHLAGRVRAEGLTNVRLAKVEPDDPQLPPGGVDTVFMVDTLHYIRDRAAYARKLRAGLAPRGRVVIIDFIPRTPEERPWGPPPEQRMSREEVDAAMAAAGLVPVKVHDFLPEQFFVEYRPETLSPQLEP